MFNLDFNLVSGVVMLLCILFVIFIFLINIISDSYFKMISRKRNKEN